MHWNYYPIVWCISYESLTEPIPAMVGVTKKTCSKNLLKYDIRALRVKFSQTVPKQQRSQIGFEKTNFRSRQKPDNPSLASSASTESKLILFWSRSCSIFSLFGNEFGNLNIGTENKMPMTPTTTKLSHFDRGKIHGHLGTNKTNSPLNLNPFHAPIQLDSSISASIGCDGVSQNIMQTEPIVMPKKGPNIEPNILIKAIFLVPDCSLVSFSTMA